MARLPNPGNDNGVWGSILNDFLSQSHKANGLLKDNSVTSNTLAPGSVTASAIASNAITSASFADQSIAKQKLSQDVQDSLVLADSALQDAPVSTVAGKTGDVLLDKSDIGLTNVDNTSDSVKNDAVATLRNKTISGLENSISNISQSSVVNLGQDLSNKANVTEVVSLSGNQTVSGAKDFTGGITINATSVVVTNDTRLSDARKPVIVDKSLWSAGTSYTSGDVVTAVGRRWMCLSPHVAGATWNQANWTLMGSVNSEYSLLEPNVFVPTEHIRAATVGSQNVVMNQNLANGVRFGIGRSATINAVQIETTNTNTTASLEFQFYTLDRATNTISSSTVIGSMPIGTFSTIGLKQLTGLSIPVTAGQDIVIGAVARSAGGPTLRGTSSAIDPVTYSIGSSYGQTGWSGVNNLTATAIGNLPIYMIRAS